MSKKFEGFWMPATLSKLHGLTVIQKNILAYSNAFGGRKCIASNRHLACCLGISVKTVRNNLTKLRKMGLMTKRNFPSIDWVVEKCTQKCPREGHSDVPSLGTEI